MLGKDKDAEKALFFAQQTVRSVLNESSSRDLAIKQPRSTNIHYFR
jgi:hypothetical protein